MRWECVPFLIRLTRFGVEIVFYTFPTRSFVNSDGIASGVPVVVNREGVLQCRGDREISCPCYDAVIFQYSVNVNNNSISPQMSGKHSRCWGDFVEICDRVVYYSIASLAQDIAAVVNECLVAGFARATRL